MNPGCILIDTKSMIRLYGNKQETQRCVKGKHAAVEGAAECLVQSRSLMELV